MCKIALPLSLQAKALAIELFKWIRDAIRPQLANIKPVQVRVMLFKGNYILVESAEKYQALCSLLFANVVDIVIKFPITEKNFKKKLLEILITLVKSQLF